MSTAPTVTSESGIPWTRRLVRKLAGSDRRQNALRAERVARYGLGILGLENSLDWKFGKNRRQISAQLLADLSPRELRKNVILDGEAYHSELVARGGGFVVAFVQEICGPLLAKLAESETPVAGVVTAAETSPDHHTHVLEAGRGVGILHTFHPDVGESFRYPLLGRLAAVSPVVAAFAGKHQVPVLPLWLRNSGDDLERWHIVAARPVMPGATEEATLLKLNAAFGRFIQEHPEDVEWTDHPWNTPASRILWSRRGDAILVPEDMRREQMPPFRILAIVPGEFRETCLALPAVRALKRGRPDARVTVLASPGVAGFWQEVSEIDACITAGGSSSGEDYQLGVVFEPAPVSLKELLGGFSVERVAGRDTAVCAGELDDLLPGRITLGPPEHRSRHYLRMVHRLGGEVVRDEGIFAPLVTGATVKAGGSLRLAVGIGSEEGDGYCWPVECVAEVIRRLSESHGCIWKIFGGGGEPDRQRAKALRRELPDVIFENLTGDASVPVRLQELSDCHAVLAHDNHLLHLAGVAGLPGVGIFGPSDPGVMLPLGGRIRAVYHHVECSPCFLATCPLDHRCMDAIAIDEVARALAEVLVVHAVAGTTNPRRD